MTLVPGQRLGPYEVLAPLGAGGMGEVYKARDVRLDRAVAIKVLPSELTGNAERLRRFELEARAASALNHPNIVTIFDIGAEGSLLFLAMELVEGRTLLDLLISGPLPVRKLLDLSVQIADAIAAAHEAGIVHRDLKPGNLMISRDGFVKLLDFGLARRDFPASAEAEHASRMATTPATAPGAVLGTVGYMSPEQARGETIDFRSDQFSFGSILYEMATRARAFRRGSAVETLTAILNDEPPPIARRRPEIPGPLRWVIERCLAKAPSERYSSTRDLARELSVIREHLSELSGEVDVKPPSPTRRMGSLLAPIAGAILLLAAGSWFGFRHVGGGGAGPVPEFRRLTFRSGFVARALFVPRSNSILYTATWDGQPLGSYLTLPQSKGVDRSLESPLQLPLAYSDDGSEALVLLGRGRPALNAFGTLAWWPALGGKPRPVVEQAGWADWARKGKFLVLVRVRGDERVLEALDPNGKTARVLFRTAGAIAWVRISPDERRVAFIHHPSRFDDSGDVRVIGIDGTGLRTVSPVFETCRGLAWDASRRGLVHGGPFGCLQHLSLGLAAARPRSAAIRVPRCSPPSGRDRWYVSSRGRHGRREAAASPGYGGAGELLMARVLPDL